MTGTVVIRLRSTLFAHGHLSDFESAPLRASMLGFLHSHVLDSKALELTLDLRFPPSEDLLLHVMISGKDVDGAWLARQLEAAFCAKKWTRIFGSRYGSLGALCTVCFSPSIGDAGRIVCGLLQGPVHHPLGRQRLQRGAHRKHRHGRAIGLAIGCAEAGAMGLGTRCQWAGTPSSVRRRRAGRLRLGKPPKCVSWMDTTDRTASRIVARDCTAENTVQSRT